AGWQNSSGFADYLPYVEAFHELGLRVVQLTYNTANAAGSGCYESRDGGLTDFGHDLVTELNRVGILIDLSHVGSRTSEDAIRASKQPVAYTHCAPKALKDHGRNKTDAELRFIAERGGMIGVTMFPPFMPRGNESTIEDYLDAIDHVIRIAGEDQVGIGTDFTQGQGQDAYDYWTRDKGTGRMLLPRLTRIDFPPGFEAIEAFPNLTAAMERRGWSEARIRKVMGGNWVRIFREVWRPTAGS
ncbi:MAG: peptidase M19, partial [Alphaproteobacteria bacterium]|nr:peptidase M19 [Alphaproteobacteria bacterium]